MSSELSFEFQISKKMEVELFIPCFVDQLYPQMGFNMIKVLEKCGVKVHFNPKQTCCGQPSFNSGHWKVTKEIADKFLRDYSGERPIVAPSASCTSFVKNYYPELSDDSAFHEKCASFKDKLFEISDFLVNQLGVTDLGAEFPTKVTIHDACSALREYKLGNEPRTLLSKVKGLEIVEMKANDVCCGFGGTFSIKMEPISTAMTEQKVESALATGAEYIVSTEASCLLQIEAYIKKHELPIKTIHIVDILARFSVNS